MTTFRKLNDGWNAEPNAPNVQIAVKGRDVVVSFLLNPWQFPQFSPEDVGKLRFVSCWRYRLGATNDEGWYLGQCRFSKAAPEWGEFYEVGGDLRLGECPDDWVEVGPALNGLRHFLFYFRDDTFECDASDWRFEVLKAEPGAGEQRKMPSIPVLSEQLERHAFKAPNGEFGWTREQVPRVVEILVERGFAILGGELWCVRDLDREWNALIPQAEGPPGVYHWETERRPDESWSSFVARCADDCISHVQKWPCPGDLPVGFSDLILYNLTWVSETEHKQLQHAV